MNPIDTKQFAEHLRSRAIDVSQRKLLISRLSGSAQEVDLTAPTNCDGYGRVRHFCLETSPGWPQNPLPIVPACASLGIVVPPTIMRAQVFQNAACAWRCWYCFVPDDLLRADEKKSRWFSADDLVALYGSEPDRPLILDLSGGSPDLVPEWTPWMMRALANAGLAESTYLWTDDNLSTSYFFDCLGKEDLTQVLTFRHYGRVCCFKGYDARSFAFNTRAAPEDFTRQFEVMRRLLELDLDLYGYATFTSPHDDAVDSGIREFIDRLQELDENLPLRVVPLQIRVFSPVQARLVGRDDRMRSLEIQEEAIAVWSLELEKRFEPKLRNLPICEIPVGHRWGAK